MTTTDLWIAPAAAIVPGQGAARWDVGTNWSEGHSPNINDSAVFDPNAMANGVKGTNTPCYVPAGDNLPTIIGLSLNDWGVPNNANQAGTLTLNSDLAANSVNLNARTNNAGNPEVIVNSGSHLFALQSLAWAGGSVTGAGDFGMGGTDSINGSSATDKPTLGSLMDVGTTFANKTYTGSLSFAQNSQPLVVQGNANINVNPNSSLTFLNQAAQGAERDRDQQ